MKGKTEEILKKRDDYRIKLFILFMQLAKQGKQFIQQKLIRKIKKSNDTIYNLGDGHEEVSMKLKETNNVKKNEILMRVLKNVKQTHMKQLALHFLAVDKEFDLSKFADYFNKECDGNYKTMLEQAKTELLDKQSIAYVFRERLRIHQRYQTFLEQADQILGILQNKLGKSKLKRSIKKEKFKLTSQMGSLKKKNNEKKEDDNASVNVNQVGLLHEGDSIKKIESYHIEAPLIQKKDSDKNRSERRNNNSNNPFEKKNRLDNKMNGVKKVAAQLKYDKLVSHYGNKDGKERTEFKKTGKERKQQIKEEKFEKRRKIETNPQIPVQNVDFKTQNIKEMDKLHPSWTARLQQQEQQKNTLSAFSGTIKML